MSATEVLERRVLILAPTGRDGALAADVLSRVGMEGFVAADAAQLCSELDRGAGAVLVAEEALSPHAMALLTSALGKQPSWSDLPFVLLAVPVDSELSSARLQKMVDTLGNVTVLERPFRVATLVTVVRAALRARERQYGARATLLSVEAATAALKLADERKDEFLAMLAHELRNPVAAISMALAMIERGPDDPQRTQKYRETAKRQVRNLVRLVDDLLDVSRISRGLVELRKEPVDLAQIVHAAVVAARPTIEAHEHTLSVEISAGDFRAQADATRIEQILANLLSNAAKYTEPGGRISVRLSMVRDGSSAAELRVRDSGRGIPAHMLDKVFDLFVQVDQSLDRTLGGLGLGLTLVKRLVELHGGTVRAQSDGPGKGSEFIVTLPLGAVARTAPETEHAATLGSVRRRIVLVEDSPDVRATMKDLLEEMGHSVLEAANGVDGLEQLLRSGADLALVDIGLPLLDGYEVARRLRQSNSGAKIYLVALTGYGGASAVKQALEAGFDAHFTKPMSITQLEELVLRRRN